MAALWGSLLVRGASGIRGPKRATASWGSEVFLRTSRGGAAGLGDCIYKAPAWVYTSLFEDWQEASSDSV